MSGNRIVVSVAFLCCLALGLAYAQAGQQETVKGLITGRTGDSMTVKTANGEQNVILTDATNIEIPEGVFHARHKHPGMTALVPGLAVEIKGTMDNQNRLTAQTIKFSKNSLQVANQIQAGLQPTESAVAANKQELGQQQQEIATNEQTIQKEQQEIGVNSQDIKQANKRFSELSDYDVKDKADAYFAPGSDKLSEKDKAAIAQLAKNAQNLKGYVIVVKGFADSTGNAVMNQQLSMNRADSVISYLEETCNVPARHMLAPSAMGTSHPAASNETAQGRADNRRVEVKLMVNRGMEAAQ